MALRTLMIVVLVSLVAATAWAQALTEPAGAGPKPAMIVDGRALTPMAFADGVQGDTVRLDGVEMLWIGAAVKASGGNATIEDTPEGRILSVRSAMHSAQYVVLPPGEFWRHPWVRQLIVDASRYGVYQLQPLPYWPYVEANIPAHPPHGVDWKRPYLQWKPDEAWLLLNLEPPPPPEPEVLAVEDEEAAEEEGEEAAAPATPAMPGGEMMGGPGAEPGMMGGPPEPGMMGGPPEPGMEPGMAPPAP